MLSFLRIRSVQSPLSHTLRARSLTTNPKPIPTYKKIWNPARNNTVRLPEPTPIIPKDAAEEDARKAEREQLRDTQGVTIPYDEGLTPHQRQIISHLNDLLWLADTDERKRCEIRLPLWEAYTSAGTQVPGLLSAMPDRSWDVLWAAQDTGSFDSPLETMRLKELYRAMHSIGKLSTVQERVAYLEGAFLFGNGWRALQEWEADRSGDKRPSRHDYKPEHLEAGVRLYALDGNADRARVIMEELFELYPDWDSSVLIPVIRAHTRSKSRKHQDMARAIYLQLRARKSGSLTLEDADACFVGFLEAKHSRHARQTFHDMIQDRHLAGSFAIDDVDAVLERLNMLYNVGTDIEKMTGIALSVMSTLPEPYHHSIFTDWMKSAVLRKAPEVAAQILDMMLSRGHRPEVTHYNLLLRALFRTKDRERMTKAENIGWQMIEESSKADTKNVSTGTRAQEIVKRADAMAERVQDCDTAKHVPSANVTTFALMTQHHAEHLQWEHVEYLKRVSKRNGVPPNTTMLNVMLNVHCRQGRYVEAWQLYRSLSEPPEGGPGCFPDGATMRCMWKILRLALADSANRASPDLPTPRQLLAETVQWWINCRSRPDADQFLMGLTASDRGAVSHLIMHCFSYVEDLPGSLIALHVLTKNLGIFPSDKAAEILQKQASWEDLQGEAQQVKSQFYHEGRRKKSFDKLGRIYYMLTEKRFERMGVAEEDVAEFGDEAYGDLCLNLLSEFVRVVLKRAYTAEAVEALIDNAKKDVGVMNMETGDLNAFNVA